MSHAGRWLMQSCRASLVHPDGGVRVYVCMAGGYAIRAVVADNAYQ
jgi:hypothetical protein